MQELQTKHQELTSLNTETIPRAEATVPGCRRSSYLTEHGLELQPVERFPTQSLPGDTAGHMHI